MLSIKHLQKNDCNLFVSFVSWVCVEIFFLLMIAGCAGDAPTLSEGATTLDYPYDRPLIVAQGGARSVAPENTILSAQRAYDFKADQWELDVHMSKDGELVLIHDDNFRRTSDVEQVFPFRLPFWKVKDFSLEEIKQLDAGSWYLKKDPFDQIQEENLSAEEQQAIENVTFPTLREALQFTQEHDWSVNIEIKDLSGEPGDVDIVEKTVALVEEMGTQESVIISSFNLDYLVRVKQANPGRNHKTHSGCCYLPQRGHRS